MKKMFKWIIDKLVRLIYGKDYIISKPKPIIEKPIVKTNKELYFEALAQNRGRIIELMDRVDKSIDEDIVKLAIQEDLKISAIKYNDWKRVYNKIKGFNDPSDELRRLIAQDDFLDRVKLQREARKLDMEGITTVVPKPKLNKTSTKTSVKMPSKLPNELYDILKSVKHEASDITLEEIRKIDDFKQAEKSKVMDRILESKNKIIK